MNKRRAQVFIATTQGLVQVLSIDRINGTNIESAVTIDNTSKIAGISHFYHNFVVKPQGLIHDIFGGKAFRLNLSKDIDQGESWQLGVFLAHYLYENDCLSNGKNTLTKQTTNDDIIYIATGRVDTLHYQVLSIDELAKKCLHANRHIAHWQSTNQQISFLAPTKNFRQPIPNSILKLTPVSHLSELFHLCTLNGVLTEALVFPNAIEASVSNNVVTIDAIQKAVSDHFDIRLADMSSRRRPSNIAFARQVAMFLSRKLTQSSLMEIGDAFGGRDHGTVIHAVKKVEQRIKGESSVRDTVDLLDAMLQRR